MSIQFNINHVDDATGLKPNEGVDYTGINLMGSAWRSPKHGQVVLVPKEYQNHPDYQSAGARIIVVTGSNGMATPATIKGFIEVAKSSGNHIVTVKRDKLPAEVVAVREQIAEVRRADWQANGPKAPGAKVAPTLPAWATNGEMVEVSGGTTNIVDVTAAKPNIVTSAGEGPQAKLSKVVASVKAMDVLDRVEFLTSLDADTRKVIQQAIAASDPKVINTPSNVPSVGGVAKPKLAPKATSNA